ncbi:MAG: FHA domain-containing protein [Cyanosarcina radialis HA8281-LM2]|jgi:pSer/pThr/pTyr-binding forkhead associated (FHA) protein|nr:FHA domain-containing protein [Cyanosarcina radialis HA8281-LM2]
MAEANQQRHLLIIEDDRGRREIVLNNSTYSLGRQSTCDIRLFSHFVSRYHATLIRRLREDGTYYYRIVDGDLQGKRSTNGILINGRKLQVHDLQDADEIVFAPQVSAVYYLLRHDSVPTGLGYELETTINTVYPDDETEERDLFQR